MNTTRNLMLALGVVAMVATTAAPAFAMSPLSWGMRIFLSPSSTGDDGGWSADGLDAADRKSRTG